MRPDTVDKTIALLIAGGAIKLEEIDLSIDESRKDRLSLKAQQVLFRNLLKISRLRKELENAEHFDKEKALHLD